MSSVPYPSSHGMGNGMLHPRHGAKGGLISMNTTAALQYAATLGQMMLCRPLSSPLVNHTSLPPSSHV